MFRSGNPTLSQRAFSGGQSFASGEAMSIQGTVNKSFFLLFLIVLSASWVWGKIIAPSSPLGIEEAARQTSANVVPLMMGGAIGGFILAMVTIFKKEWGKITAPLYALCEGMFLGGISAVFEIQYPGIVMQAVALTFGTLFCLLTCYRLKIVTVTEKFRLGVFAATGAIAMIYLVNFIMGFFGGGMSFITSSGTMGIVFSLIVVTIAALNLVLDFDLIDRLSHQGAPKYMEWYGAFALMVTLVWLYLEILRLLAKMQNRR